MYRLTVFYPRPTDTEHFRTYYESKHLPLARQLPNVRNATYSLDITGVTGESPYYALWEADFDSPEAMGEALESAVGQQLIDDVPHYATGGAIIVHYALNGGDDK